MPSADMSFPLGEKVQSDNLANLEFFCPVNDAHPAFAELLENLVMGDGLANH